MLHLFYNIYNQNLIKLIIFIKKTTNFVKKVDYISLIFKTY
jgi:hypothetical protein